jgi:mannose-6-phosphate isomerase-like protein (cupin superfamily)
MGIEFKERTVHLREGEMFVVPRGEEHKPFAENECKVLLVEPRGVVNTGESGGALTAKNDVWI